MPGQPIDSQGAALPLFYWMSPPWPVDHIISPSKEVKQVEEELCMGRTLGAQTGAGRSDLTGGVIGVLREKQNKTAIQPANLILVLLLHYIF